MTKSMAGLTAVALIVFACAAAFLVGAAPNPNMTGAIKIDGSSTVGPISEAVAEEFAAVSPKVKVTVGISGTGGGFKRFVVGETDISNASRPIKHEENEKASSSAVSYVEVPVAYDGLSIVVNPKNNWVDHLTMDEIKKIFVDGSNTKTWQDIRPSWPAKPLKIFSPGTDSGTFDYFKEVVVGSAGSVRSDMSVSEDDNVLVKGVIGDENAIGFFGCAYYFENQNKLRAVPIDAGKGPVSPTHETIEKGTYAPFSRPLFIYINRKSLDRPEVRAFVGFYLEQAGDLAEEVGYVKLPDAIYQRAIKNVTDGRTGSQFLSDTGEPLHGPLTELYR